MNGYVHNDIYLIRQCDNYRSGPNSDKNVLTTTTRTITDKNRKTQALAVQF